MFVKKSNYVNLCNDYEELYEKYRLTNIELKDWQRKEENFFKLAERVNSELETMRLLKITNNNYNEPCFIMGFEKEDDFSLRLFSTSRFKTGNNTFLNASSKGMWHSEYPNDMIKIHDICSRDTDRGHGTILLQCLEELAKKRQKKIIKGWLSPVDRESFPKLTHFYKKNGFQVSFSEDGISGNIEKRL
ncbi:GNAT family N-acetyltransferase [Enterococcus faecalis]|uniref:hypothetical protein n=1 Tax=Enterococcus faecalis TaxID=1351 RepID=UPI003D6A3FF7